MAQNQANFGLNFRVDKSGLNELKKSLQDIMRLGQKNSATGTMTKELEEACKAARQLETILDGAWNSKLGQLNLDKVNQGIKTTYHSVEELQTALGKTPQGQTAFNKMASQVLNTNLQLKQTNKLLDDMATSMANTVKWGITSSIFNNMTRSVQDAFYYVKNLDSSLNDIRIVTGASADQMAAFAEKANTAAKALGQSTRAYTDASLIYYQQGLSEQDVAARAETTLKAANVTGQNTEQVSELLTSVWNGYKVSAAEAELYIDKIAAVAATTASDLEELSVGMSKVASAASLMGVDIDQLNAQLATIVSVTRQAPESVGTALKTIYARMGDIEAGLDGETTLGNYTEQMKEMGFNVLDAQGKLRDMGSIIEEIGAKWSNMTREQQLSLAQTVAGTRQYNNLLALFDNWDMYTGALNTSATAMGTLQEQQDIYMESTKAQIQELKTELESTYSSLLDTDTLNAGINALTGLVEQFNAFIDGLGRGEQALAYFGSMAVNVFSKQIGSSIFNTIENIKSVKTNLEAFKAKEKWADNILKDVNEQYLAKGEGKLDDSALAKEAQYAQKTLQIRQALTQEQYDQFTSMQAEIGLKERELNYLREYQNLSSEIMDYDDASTQALEERLALEEKLLSQRESRRDSTSKELRFLGSVESDEDDQDILLQRLGTLGNIVATEEEYVALETIADKIRANTNLTEKENALVLDLEKRLVAEQKEVVQKIKQAIEGKKAAENGTLDILEEEQAARERILRQQQEQAEKQFKIQKAVQAVGTALEIGTALVNAMAVGFDKASSGAEKANAAFAGITGVAAGIADYFFPGTGILVQGAFSLVKAGLEAAGAWDWIEDKFKSTAEKIAEIDEGVSKNNLLNQQTNSQISSLKAIEEEYALLSVKAGQYGENLDEMTEEEQNRYHELTNAFTQYNEAVILGYDAQGNAIVNNQTALKETIRLLREQAEERARENLGDISEALKTKQKNIDSAQKEYDDAKAESDFYQTEEGAKARTDLFKEKVQQVSSLLTYYADGVNESVHESVRILSESLQNTTSLTDEQFTDSFNTLSNAYDAAINYINNTFGEEGLRNAEIGYSGLKDYFSIWDDIQGALVAAESQLEQVQKFDTNWIMQVLQFGEGYDDQWDSLSYEGQDIGYNLVLQYLEGITYGIEEGQADKYEDVIAMGQTFITGLQQAIDVGFTNIETAASDFNTNKDNIKLTVSQREEAIKNIILEEIQNIGNFSELEEPVKEALELMFENAFNINLELNDQGQISTLEHQTRQYLKNAQTAINDAAKENFIPDESVSQEYLESLLSPEELQNIDQIIQNIDWSRMRVEGLSLEEALIAAKEAAENGQTVISKLREEATMGEDILNKLQNKEELTNDEMAYLNSLTEEEEILQGLAIGTEEYNNALLEVLATRKKNNEIKLRNEIKDTTDELRIERADNDRIKAEQKEYLDHGGKKTDEAYINMQAAIDVNDTEITDLEAYLANLQYEILCLAKVEADPDIASQIRNLYSDADTLISIRTTLEDDKALSEDQTQALSGFFASESGQNYAREYAESGILTEQMLTAIEAFAQGKQELGDIARTNLEEEIQKYLSAADLAKQEAQNLREQGDIQGAEEKEEEATTNYSAAATRTAELAQIDSEDVEKEQQSFETEMEDFGLESDEVEDLADSIQDMAESSDELADSLKYDEDAAREVAKELKRYDKALDSVKDNYDDWMDALDSDNIEIQAEAVDDMDKAYSDLLDLDYGTLSDEFLTNAENLELMKEAANGSTEAYDELANRAQNDILTQCNFDVNDEEAMAKINALENEITTGIDDIEVGASIDDANAIAAMNELINMAGMTAEQATNYLASMGVDAEVETTEVPESQKQAFISATPNITYEDASVPTILPDGNTESTTVQVPKITYDPTPQTEVAEGTKKATALRVVSANKSSGGGFKHTNSRAGGSPSGGSGGGKKGGGGGKGSAPKKTKARKKDYYHNVNNSLQKLSTAYDKLAEVQDKTFGQKHIDNIKKTNENLDKQIDKMRERIKIANEQEKVDLKKEITKNYKDVKFNKDGTIKNYENILAKYYKKYENAKSQESQDKAKEKYDELKELLDNYETLILETIPDWEAEVREKIDEKYENMVHQFEYEIEMRVNWGDSVREVREFFHEISDYSEDFKNIASFNFDQATSYFDSNEITSRTRQLSDALGELDKINAANAKGYKITNKDEEKYFSDIWGDNKEGLMDYIATLQTDLMDAILNIQDSRDNAYDAYLDAIDEGIDKMDRHLEQYEIINEQLEHNRNLIELIYGETSDQLANIYAEQRNVQLEQIKGQKNAADMYYERMIDAQNRLNKETKGTDRYKEIEEEVEQFTDQYNEAISNVNATVEESIELIISKYEYAVQQIFKNINNDLLNTSVMSATDPLNNLQIGSLEEASLHWDLLNQKAEQYLDATNSTFEVQKLEAKYLDALNQTDNLKAQQKISDVMNEQISMLEKKDELSQYEVDRANLIYDLTLKQIALEEAQQNKSKMRLRRDAQGNYSYQFTADADLIKQTQQELLDVQQQLYNLDKDNYQSQLNEMYGYYVEWQEKLAEVAMIKDVEERERTAALVNDYYTKLMQNANDQAQIAKTNLDELVEGPLADFYKANEDIAIGPNGLSSMYESALSVLSDKFAGEDGISNQVQTAWEDISKKAEIYKEELDAIASASGEAFDKLSTDEELNKITGGIGDITTATEALGKEWKTVLDSISEFVNKLDALLKDEKIKKAKEVIKESEKVETTELKTSGDAAEKANITAVADPVPEPTKTTTTTTNNNKNKEDKKDDKNKNKNKTKTIKKGGKINAKGAKIYDAPGGTGKTQYYKNDPKYKVLKISGNWVQARYHKLSSGVSGWFKKSAVKALNTGGYTGDWNSNEGRIALLHKKELVLNQKDTKNILDAVNIIRGLGGLLQNSMVSRIEGLTQSLNGITIPTVQNNPETGPQSVEQTVHITAEFPGATEVIQIEQALENLVSRASQYAFRRKE